MCTGNRTGGSNPLLPPESLYTVRLRAFYFTLNCKVNLYLLANDTLLHILHNLFNIVLRFQYIFFIVSSHNKRHPIWHALFYTFILLLNIIVSHFIVWNTIHHYYMFYVYNDLNSQCASYSIPINWL